MGSKTLRHRPAPTMWLGAWGAVRGVGQSAGEEPSRTLVDSWKKLGLFTKSCLEAHIEGFHKVLTGLMGLARVFKMFSQGSKTVQQGFTKSLTTV